MTDYWQVVFWVSVGIVFYSYIGFTFLLFLMGKILRRKVDKKPVQPSISLIIAAFNEEKGIRSKIENSLSLDYPKDKLEIIIGSDGSEDQTEAIARSFSDVRLSFIQFPRRGKIFVLKDCIAKAKGEIIVFSDANTDYHPEALKKLVQNFNDPSVGGVCGNQLHKKHKTQDNASEGEGLYWSFDKTLKMYENQTGSIVSADGAIYAIRKSLFKMPTDTATTDDFAISTGIIEQGYRLVFEPEALAYEEHTANTEKEFSRKMRIMNRGLRGVIMRKKLLNPFKYGFYSVILFSHKILRRCVPFFLIALFIASCFLFTQNMFFAVFTLLQTAFYSLAALGYFLRKTSIARKKILFIPFFFCMANAAAMFAIINLLRGKRIELWNPQRHENLAKQK